MINCPETKETQVINLSINIDFIKPAISSFQACADDLMLDYQYHKITPRLHWLNRDFMSLLTHCLLVDDTNARDLGRNSLRFRIKIGKETNKIFMIVFLKIPLQ